MDSRESLLTLIRRKWGKGAVLVIGTGIFLVAISFQSGNSIGVGISLAEITHTSPLPWVIGSALTGIGLLFFRTFYAILSKLMITIVILMLFSFLVTCCMSRPSFTGVMNGFIPSLPVGSGALVIAFIASCFSLVGAFYQSYLVQQRSVNLDDEAREKLKDRSLTGMLLLGIMSAAVMICAAAVLHSQGIKIRTAADMGKALEPLFGINASHLFLTGLFFASFSTLIGNAVLGGTLLSDSLGYGSDMNLFRSKLFIALIIVVGCIIAACFGTVPLQMIVFAQSITVLVVPVIGVALFIVSNDKEIMGELTNSRLTNIAAALGLILILFLAIVQIKRLFF